MKTLKDMKILIAGGGVAGLTCAALLNRLGAQLTLVEKESEEFITSRGYMLGLLPLGGRVLNQLELTEAYFDSSIEMTGYEIHSSTGRILKGFPLDFINRDYGSYRGIGRGDLIRVLLNAVPRDSIRFDTLVEGIEQDGAGAEVTFSGGNREQFDLVIVADGLHSSTRDLVFDARNQSAFDTGWGGWVTWVDDEEDHIYREYWGASAFMGSYPVKHHSGVFIGGPNRILDRLGRDRFLEILSSQFSGDSPVLQSAFGHLKAENDPFFWRFADGRADHWVKDRVVLLADAAAGFLPTAGAGASMAMSSAAVLADELSRMDGDHVNYALSLFEKRRKPVVLAGQKDSRKLSRLMFVSSLSRASLRNLSLNFYRLESFAEEISRMMEV